MLTAMFITLREGLEAALVVAIVLSFLRRSGAMAMKRYVWTGTALAAGLSVVAGSVLYMVSAELSDEAGEFFEIAITVLAVAVLTYMVLWMRGHGPSVAQRLASRTGHAVRTASPLALILLAFSAVGREGLETVLFLFAAASSGGAAPTIAGASVGLAMACLAGVLLYRGASQFDLRTFFAVTGFLLIVLAAGIFGHVLGEMGELGAPASLTGPVWDTGGLLSDEHGAGALLKTLLGYEAQPSAIQVLGYWSYLALMTWLYFRPAFVRLLGRLPVQARQK